MNRNGLMDANLDFQAWLAATHRRREALATRSAKAATAKPPRCPRIKKTKAA